MDICEEVYVALSMVLRSAASPRSKIVIMCG